jgi:hypothetical protein
VEGTERSTSTSRTLHARYTGIVGRAVRVGLVLSLQRVTNLSIVSPAASASPTCEHSCACPCPCPSYIKGTCHEVSCINSRPLVALAMEHDGSDNSGAYTVS